MSPQPYKPKYLEARPYSFDLHVDMVKALAEEFDARSVARSYAKSGDAAAVFGSYGENFAKKVVELGNEYTDRTNDVLKEILARTKGAYNFPLLPQRSLEIAYLSTQDFVTLPILANNPSEIVFRIADCTIYKAVREESGESKAAEMPCSHACLGLCNGINKGHGISANVAMEASMAKDGYCQFAIKPGK